MANTYYDSDLTGDQIEAALTAIDGVVTPSNNGKVLCVENGKIVAKSASTWGGTNLIAKTITQNGSYNPSADNADGYSLVTVNVPSEEAVLEPLNVTANGDYSPGTGVDGFDEVHVSVPTTANLQSKTVTQNGVVLPDSGYDGLSSVVVNVSGGGGGTLESWDLTDSLTGELRGLPMTAGNVSLSAGGAVFDGTSDYLSAPLGYNGLTIEIDVASMSLTSGTHRRFIMATTDNGLIYRSTGVWAFYNNNWVESAETDGSFFDGSTVKAHVDVNGYWHIYKDGVLWWEPGVIQALSGSWYLGSSRQSINNAVISGVRIA